ncbi:MAG: restriction endonuclease subunit S [Lachnospiraceae bacterium]
MEYKLEELFELQMGKTPSRDKREYWENGRNKWISIADLSKSGKYICETKEHLSDKALTETRISPIPENTVVMSFKLSIGKIAITSETMYSNEAIMAFRDSHKVKLLPEYVYYLLMAHDWNAGTNKAVMGKTLNKATLSKTKVNVHSYEKQLEIVQILNQITNIIEVRNQQLEWLEKMVQARFVEMFGTLDNPSQKFQRATLKELCKRLQMVNMVVVLQKKVLKKIFCRGKGNI